MTLTTRHFSFPLEVRDAETPVLKGYAAVFDSLSLDLGGFRERIDPHAFDATLADQINDVMALWSHDWSMPLGRRSAGTLTLTTDEHGLAVEITPDGTSWSQDALAAVRSGNVKGMSFGFQVLDDSWDYETKVRTLNKVALAEVSLVTLPAYPATEAAVRSLVTELEDSFNAHVQNTAFMALNVRKIEFLKRKG